MIVRRAKYFFKFNIIKDIRNADNFLLQRPLLLRPNECSGKSTKKKKKKNQDKKQNRGCFGLQSARAHTCVYQHGRVRGVSVSPIGDIYLNAFFFTRILRVHADYP